MRNRNPKVVEIIDEYSYIFKCKKCGRVWIPNILEGRRIARGGWHCPNGCKAHEPVKLRRSVSKSGNSYRITLPMPIVKTLGVDVKDEFLIWMEDSKIIMLKTK